MVKSASPEEHVKGYQFNEMKMSLENFIDKSEIRNQNFLKMLEDIKRNTEGIVTWPQMEKFAEDQISRVRKELDIEKANSDKKIAELEAESANSRSKILVVVLTAAVSFATALVSIFLKMGGG